jgi:hypothetical protein
LLVSLLLVLVANRRREIEESEMEGADRKVAHWRTIMELVPINNMYNDNKIK